MRVAGGDPCLRIINAEGLPQPNDTLMVSIPFLNMLVSRQQFQATEIQSFALNDRLPIETMKIA